MARLDFVRAGTIALLAASGIVSGWPALADTPSTTPTWLEDVTFNGFLETSYSYNFNRPPTGTNQFRVFDFDDNTFKLDVFELVAQKAVSKPRESGFRVDVAMGGSVPRVSASAGLFRDASGAAEDVDLQQAFVSYVAPVGSGLRFDLGKFVTGHGYEVIQGYDGWNDNATRSILFGYAIPFTHTGARATYAFSPKVSAQLMVVNGWDVATDNNHSKSVGGQLTLVPVAPLTLIVNGMIGPEQSGNDADSRSLLDAVAIWKPYARVTVGGNADWATEDGATFSGADASWRGFAGYLRVATTGPCAISLRAEIFDDTNGVRTGVRQRLREITLTHDARLTPHLLLRGDVRVDHSNQRIFDQSDAGQRYSQTTVLLEALYSF